MVIEPIRDRRAERRESTRAEILEAAWKLARNDGLAGLSLRDVAATIGMRPPSLYWYFDSKHDIYDAMFAEGNRALLEVLAAQSWPEEPRALLCAVARVFVGFGVADPTRYHLLFQRVVPDFEPSAGSYDLALQVMEQGRALMAAAGVTDAVHFDLWTALVAGLCAQQVSNEPGGDRWVRLVDEAADMYANHVFGAKGPRRKR